MCINSDKLVTSCVRGLVTCLQMKPYMFVTKLLIVYIPNSVYTMHTPDMQYSNIMNFKDMPKLMSKLYNYYLACILLAF